MLDNKPFNVNSCSLCVNHKSKTEGLNEVCMRCLLDRKGNKTNFVKCSAGSLPLSMFKPKIKGVSYDK